MKQIRPFLKVVLLLILASNYGIAQDKNQYRFAQTYFGATSSMATNLFSNSSNLNTPTSFSQRLVIGGLHFWSKADFYVSFPLVTKSLESGSSDAFYSEGVITGGRWIPLGLKNNGFRPYVGGAWLTPYLNTGVNADEKHDILLDLGLIYVFKKRWSLEMGVHRTMFNEWNFNLGTKTEKWNQPQVVFDFSIKKYFDFTAGLESENAQKRVSEVKQKMTENGDRSTWAIAVGMSSNIPVSTASKLKNAGISDIGSIGIMPEYGISYYAHKLDAAFRLDYRNAFSDATKQGHSFKLKEQKLGIEAFKFLFNYQGFVPFVGVGADLHQFKTGLRIGSNEFEPVSGRITSPSIIFGWDIRPSDVEWYILRTNLRYKPRINSSFSDFQQATVEFNFIQWVLYPARLKYHFNKKA